MTSLVPFTQPNSPADAVREVARTDAAVEVLKEHKKQVKAWLDGRMTELREQAGSKVNVKGASDSSAFYSGGKLQLTVTDDEAFGTWLTEHRPDDVEWTERVQADPDDLAWLLSLAESGDALFDLREAIVKVVTRVGVPVFAEGLLDDLLLDATETHLHVRLHDPDDGAPKLFDVASGEVVPGLSVSRTSETLTVRGGKLKKAYVEQMKQQLFDGADALDQGDDDG